VGIIIIIIIIVLDDTVFIWHHKMAKVTVVCYTANTLVLRWHLLNVVEW